MKDVRPRLLIAHDIARIFLRLSALRVGRRFDDGSLLLSGNDTYIYKEGIRLYFVDCVGLTRV